jgi:glycosyltransferase involved in cell wall biosynthesis
MNGVRLLHAFSTFSTGGAQARFVRLVREFGGSFHHIVTSMDRRFDTARLLSDFPNVEIFDIASSRGRNLNNVPRFISALRSIRPERIVTYNFGTIEWSFANAWVRLPHLHVEDGFGPEEADRRLRRRSLLRTAGLRLSGAKLITISQSIAEVAREEWHLPRERIILIPNGIDADAYKSVAERGRPSRFAPAGEIVIGTVAGLRAEKRLDRLLHAVASLPRSDRVVLVIAGDGPLRAELESLSKALLIQDRTHFLGHMDCVNSLYAEFDIFALSSDTEQLPMVLLESMAAGLPIASTDVGDIRSVLGGDNHKWLCERTHEALSAVLHEMIGSPGKRQEIGRDNARIVRAHYAANGMFEAWRRELQGQQAGDRRDR